MTIAEEVKEALSVRSVQLFMQPWISFSIKLFEDNGRTITGAENLLSSGNSKHIDVLWRFIRDSVKTQVTTVTHVELRWQRAGIFTKAPSTSSLNGTGRGS